MRKTSLLLVLTLLILLVCPLWVFAQVVRDQPVQMINLNDLLTPDSADEILVSSALEDESLVFLQVRFQK